MNPTPFREWPTIKHNGELDPRPDLADITKPSTTDYGTGDIAKLADAIDRYHNKEV